MHTSKWKQDFLLLCNFQPRNEEVSDLSVLQGQFCYSGLGRGIMNFWRLFIMPALISRKKKNCLLLWEDVVSNFHLLKFQKVFFNFLDFSMRDFFHKAFNIHAFLNIALNS